MASGAATTGSGLASALGAARKTLVSCFVLLHVSAVLFWNIPMQPFGEDVRHADLPGWVRPQERRLFDWKAWLVNHRNDPHAPLDARAAGVLYDYIVETATWQNWGMFAPNPINIDRYITVKAVIGYGLGHDREKNPKYIYDETPLYTSYRGTLDEEMTRFGGSYVPDHKLVENLTLGEWPAEIWLGQFARYWFNVYNAMPAHRSKPAIEMHVICHEWRFPDPWAGVSLSSTPPSSEWIIWWYKPQ
jgi:hypothetical protein